MLVITGTYIVKPGLRDEFLEEIFKSGIYAEFLKEEGNISYDYYYPCGNSDAVFFFERWKDREAWEAHKAAPHTEKLQEIKAGYLTGFEPGIQGDMAV